MSSGLCPQVFESPKQRIVAPMLAIVHGSFYQDNAKPRIESLTSHWGKQTDLLDAEITTHSLVSMRGRRVAELHTLLFVGFVQGVAPDNRSATIVAK